LAAGAAATGFAARNFKVVKLFKSPDGYPNALDADKRGIWIGEQMNDMAYLLDMNGKVLHSVQTECSNTSGLAYGDGFLWLSSNGKPLRRPPKPTDYAAGGVIKTDPETGKSVARYPVPGGGSGIHGLEFAEGTLWITSLGIQKLTQVDPKDFRIINQISVQYGRAHGLAWDPPGLWCVFTSNRLIQKLDPKDGRVLDEISISKDDPEPHGLCMREGKLYYGDAFIEPTGEAKPADAGYICRIDFA
jgi:hypothetical protein